MSSRITSSILTSNYLLDMQRNLSNMKTLQSQLSSGNEIQKPSDNPYKFSRSLKIHTEISSNEQYNENIKDIGNWLDTTDTSLSQVGTLFGRIETLLDKSGGNATYDNDERLAIEKEVTLKVDELAQILDTNFDGQYIFGGSKITSKPLTVVDGKIQYADSDGKAVAITAYKDSSGNITSNGGATNGTVTMPTLDADKTAVITKLKTERDNATTTDERRQDITKVLQEITKVPAGTVYNATGSSAITITSTTNSNELTSEQHVNKQITLSATDITGLQKELNGLDYTDTDTTSTNYKRIDEINGLLYDTSTISLAVIKSTQKNLKLNPSDTSYPTITQIKALNAANKVVSINQTNSALNVDISQGVSSTYNKTAIEIMEFTDKNGKKINVSDLLSDIIRNLNVNGDTKQLIDSNLADIKSATSNLLMKRAEVGAMQNRMDSAKENNEAQNYNMTDILSKTQDIDFTQKTMEYAVMQTVYTAALQASAKVLPQTLLNYL